MSHLTEGCNSLAPYWERVEMPPNKIVVDYANEYLGACLVSWRNQGCFIANGSLVSLVCVESECIGLNVQFQRVVIIRVWVILEVSLID